MSLMKLKDNKPTERWQQWFQTGDDRYTEEVLSQCKQVLDEYIDALAELGSNPDSEAIMTCVKNVVIGLNEMDENHYFIETEEREALCDFIFTAAKTAGLETTEDITEQWREW